MNEKTCGTCENWTRTLHNEGVCIMQSVCGDCDDRENLVVTYEADKCGMPADYYERTDSLEAVALDAVRKLEKAAALIDVERWEQIVYSQVGDLRARLKALGVEL